MEPSEEDHAVDAATSTGEKRRPGGGAEGSKMKKGVKTPLWRCQGCGWHLYVPEPCPLCSGAASLPPDLAVHERVPPWRPPISASGEAGRKTTHDDDEEEEEDSDESESESDQDVVRQDEEESEDDDELASMMGGGWHPPPKPGSLSAGPPRREVKVWNVGTVGQKKKKPIPPAPEGATRFVCISDTHNKHRLLDLPAGDVLVHSGDFSLSCKEKELVDFTEWLQDQPYTHKIVVAGNHDVLMHSVFYERHHWRFHTEKVERHRELKQRLQDVCTYLEDDLCEINGIKVWGSPWVPYYHDWAFMLPDDAGLRAAWAKVPAGVDVLITHGPPHKVRDQTYHGAHAGCAQLSEAVFKRIKPAVHCFGHIHSGYGMAKQRDSTFINAAIVNTRYKVANTAVVFDIM